MALTAGERATSINFDDEFETAYVVTYNRPLITGLRANPSAKEVTSKQTAKLGGAEFSVPKKLVTIRRPTKAGADRKPRAPMTQEHKDKLQAGRLAKKAANAL